MKKKMVIMACCALAAGVAFADLAVSFNNGNVGVTVTGTGDFITAGSLVQLIWSPTGITTTTPGGYDIAGGTLLPGEQLLVAALTSNGFGFWAPTSGLYTDATVGGTIQDGYFFTRVFQNSGAAGEVFSDLNQVAAADYIYDSLTPSTTYSANGTGLAPGSSVNLSAPGTFVQVPEPATVGLLGLSGVGLFLARRKNRR